MQQILVLLLCLCGAVYSEKIELNFRYNKATINLPVKIEVFQSRGLLVSIPDTEGLELFSFHGKVRSANSGYEMYSSSIASDIDKSTNGRWLFKDNDIRLAIGDTLHFWVFIKYKGTGQRINNLRYKVENLIPGSLTDAEIRPARPITPAITPSRRPETSDLDTDARPSFDSSNRGSENTENKQTCGCVCNENTLKDIWTQMNVTAGKLRLLEDETIPTLENKILSLTETLDELIDIQDVGTQLFLTGNLPLATNAVEDVRHLLIEKLKLQDLNTRIVQGSYKNNGILFEMASPVDKLRILRRSKDMLSKLKLYITDPQKPLIDVRTD